MEAVGEVLQEMMWESVSAKVSGIMTMIKIGERMVIMIMIMMTMTMIVT